MPYIKPEDRKKFDSIIGQLPDMNDGEFNYVETSVGHRFIKQHGLRYMTLARVVGGLICVVLELYRRVTAPYEDKKIRENGPVSGLDDDSSERMR